MSSGRRAESHSSVAKTQIRTDTIRQPAQFLLSTTIEYTITQINFPVYPSLRFLQIFFFMSSQWSKYIAPESWIQAISVWLWARSLCFILNRGRRGWKKTPLIKQWWDVLDNHKNNKQWNASMVVKLIILVGTDPVTKPDANDTKERKRK